jgi:quinoprotein glucose dehydrogenase
MRLPTKLIAFAVFSGILLTILVDLAAAPNETKKDAALYNPAIKAASDEGEAAIKRFQFDKSLKVDLWAAEPMLANPVSFSFDEKGRCFVAETFRMKAGVTDNRDHNWLEDDLACRTVEDRVNMYRKYAKNDFARTYERERDRVRLLEDTTGSGKADKTTVFFDDFGKAEDGIAAGVLARQGSVYLTNIPGLYRLQDTKGAGQANVKETLSTGFGVHVSFFGHDLHGLRIGPDGRLYFSSGDRGFNVKTKEGKHLFYPDTGAVLRCELDGSHLEVVHIGLRNPQELAFDDYGNLFTVDNNSDSGDRARLVYIVEGGDSGWRIGYQYGSSMHDSSVKQGNRGPWNYEKLWQPFHAGQPAYIVPSFSNFTDGPSGLCHYPGLGLPDKFKGHFFVCDFRGNSSGSGVWSFAVKPKGAGFELDNPQRFLWNVLATDCDFGPDSAFYVSDWTEGWGKPNKGRIYKLSDPEAQKSAAVHEAKKLLADGFGSRPVAELVKLLAHPHQQVRMEAQFALASKGKPAIVLFAKEAKEGKNQLARLHAIWGLGQLLRSLEAPEYATIQKLLQEISKDADAEVRAQAANAMRDAHDLNSGKRLPIESLRRLAELLDDPEARVRFLAAQSLAAFNPFVVSGTGKSIVIIPQSPAEMNVHEFVHSALVGMIRTNADQDPYLRYAATRALRFHTNEDDRRDPSQSVRLGALLAWRRLFEDASVPRMFESNDLGVFLNDSSPLVVAEAVRFIHDERRMDDVRWPGEIKDKKSQMRTVAALLTKPNMPIEVVYRSLNANFLVGETANAAALADFAARPDAPANLRVLALQMLAAWPKPPRRDFISGLTQDLPARDTSVAAMALQARLGGVFAGPTVVQTEAAKVAGKLGITDVGPFLFRILTDAKAPLTARVEAIAALDALNDKRLAEATAAAIGSDQPRLRNAGRAVLLKSKPGEVVAQIKGVLAKGDVAEQQGAFALLAAIKSPEADEVLAQWLDKLGKKQVVPEVQLDVLEAAGQRDSARLKGLVKSYESTRPKGDDLVPWREALFGGDAARGRDIFLNKAAVSCQRCHKLDGAGGEVGPPLNGLGGKQKRDYLLEAIVMPNKQIAKGYESVLITKTDGKSITGVLKSEDAKEVRVMTAEGLLVVIKKEDIDERRATKTAMPEDVVQKLTKPELRDLVEFLASLKEEWKK